MDLAFVKCWQVRLLGQILYDVAKECMRTSRVEFARSAARKVSLAKNVCSLCRYLCSLIGRTMLWRFTVRDELAHYSRASCDIEYNVREDILLAFFFCIWRNNCFLCA